MEQQLAVEAELRRLADQGYREDEVLWVSERLLRKRGTWPWNARVPPERSQRLGSLQAQGRARRQGCRRVFGCPRAWNSPRLRVARSCGFLEDVIAIGRARACGLDQSRQSSLRAS